MQSSVSQKNVLARKGIPGSDPKPSLRSLVVPWSTIALIAVVATAVTVLITSDNDQEIVQEEVALFDFRKLAAEVREHFTNGPTGLIKPPTHTCTPLLLYCHSPSRAV